MIIKKNTKKINLLIHLLHNNSTEKKNKNYPINIFASVGYIISNANDFS